ncbi:MAG: hypothetical protein ACJ8AW_19180 [Rhodopila sp.]
MPTGDRTHAQPGVFIISNAWEMSAQFDHGGELATLIVGPADGLSRRFVHTEHDANLRAGTTDSQVTLP